jgi:hypothetical protein
MVECNYAVFDDDGQDDGSCLWARDLLGLPCITARQCEIRSGAIERLFDMFNRANEAARRDGSTHP